MFVLIWILHSNHITGIYAHKDVSYCSPEELETIASFLKAIPKRNFLKALGIEK